MLLLLLPQLAVLVLLTVSSRLRTLSLWLIRAHDRGGPSSLSNTRPRCWTCDVRPRRRDKLSAACANGKQLKLRLPLPVASPLLPSVAAAALSRQLQWYCLLLLLLPLLRMLLPAL
jgi:hypothetical protein